MEDARERDLNMECNPVDFFFWEDHLRGIMYPTAAPTANIFRDSINQDFQVIETHPESWEVIVNQ